MSERIFCQSCGMPLEKEEDYGTNKDGSRNGDYCRYCYQGGAFTNPEATLDWMVALNLKFNEENGHPMGTNQEAEAMMRAWMPTLKRWSGKAQ